MIVQDILEGLTYGEASQLSLGNIEGDGIVFKDLPQVISAINIGVRELYKRFSLSTKFFKLTHVLGQKDYTTIDGVPSDILTLYSAVDELGKPYRINDTNADNKYIFSIYCYDGAIITIPFDPRLTTNVIEFQYRANPSKLDLYKDKADIQVIALPDQFLEPLLNYTAHRLFLGLDVNSANTATFYGRYEASLRVIENTGSYEKQAGDSNKLYINGWP